LFASSSLLLVYCAAPSVAETLQRRLKLQYCAINWRKWLWLNLKRHSLISLNLARKIKRISSQ